MELSDLEKNVRHVRVKMAHSEFYRKADCCYDTDCYMLDNCYNESCWGKVSIIEIEYLDDDCYNIHGCEGHVDYLGKYKSEIGVNGI